MTSETKTDHAKEQARAQLESITEMVKRLEHVSECDGVDCQLTDAEIYAGINLHYEKGSKATEEEREEYHAEDVARQIIQEDPLEVSVRNDWHVPGADSESTDYLILLCTGGPACRIVGELNQWNEPETAKLEYQDWFTPWTNYSLTSEEEETLLTYARQFYFGES